MNLFLPNAYYNNIYDINFKKLKEFGIKYLFFDVDNTILPYTSELPDEKSINLFNKLKKDGFECILFSNSASGRIDDIKKHLGINAYTSCMKPLKKNYKKVLKNYNQEECAFIGDQIMTDVLGAKRNNFYVILLDRLEDIEPFTTKVWRLLEKRVIKKLNKKYDFKKGRYYE